MASASRPVEHVGEQVVIAEPLPVLVERDEEQILPLHPIEKRATHSCLPGDGIAERSV